MNGFEMILPFLKPIEHLTPDDSISEVIVDGPDRGSELEIVFVIREIFRHRDQFASDVISVCEDASDAFGAGFGAALCFGMSCPCAGVINIPAATISRVTGDLESLTRVAKSL